MCCQETILLHSPWFHTLFIIISIAFMQIKNVYLCLYKDILCLYLSNLFRIYYLGHRVPIPSSFSLFFSSHHPLNSPTERGGKKRPFFLSKPKSKNPLLWGSQPSEISSCEIGARPAWSRWSRQKIPFQGDRNKQNTSYLSCHALPVPLPSTHYSSPPPLIHLSELFRVVASNLSQTPLPGVIGVDALITAL